MIPMAVAAVIVVASGAVNVTLDVGLNTLQNWSDVFYRDAFWGRRDISSPEMSQVAQEEAEIARLMAGPAFAVGPTDRAELVTQPTGPAAK